MGIMLGYNGGVESSTFVNTTTVIVGNPTHSSFDYFGNGSIGATVGPTDKQVDPGYMLQNMAEGANLFPPPIPL